MQKEIIFTLARSILIALGGVFVQRGYIDDAGLQQAVGAALVLGAGAWGVWQKVRAQKALEAAKQG